MTPQMSRSAIDRLGRRLRAAGAVTEEDLRILQEFRRQHAEPLEQAANVVRDQLGLSPTTRLKTVGTLVEKLKRSTGMRLSSVQDVAGMRLVVAGTRGDQDRVVEQLCGVFEGAKVRDRRQDPSHGYRAVHVIMKMHGFQVEMQVRTVLQDRWAQLVERLGDTWGRQIRYGGLPYEPDTPVAPYMTRAQVWQLVCELSEAIHGIEQLELMVADMDLRLSATLSDRDHHPDPEVDKLSREAREARDRAVSARDSAKTTLHEVLDALAALSELG